MKKRIIIQMEGGLGKQIALSSLIPYFVDKYEQIIVVSSHPIVFEHNPNVYRALSFTTPHAYEDYFKDADDIVYPCGYRDSDFRKRRIHLIEAACNSINIPYQPEIMKPQMYLTESEKEIVKEFKEKLGSYIIVQAHGGRGVQGGSPANVMAKDYNIMRMEAVVDGLSKLYPTVNVINYAFSNETTIRGTINLDFSIPIWLGLLQESEVFISIDSSLQHMSAINNKKGIVLWGATDPKCFGWEHNINLKGSCSFNDLHCTRPYFVPSLDLKSDGNVWECSTKECMRIDPNRILDEIRTFDINIKKIPSEDIKKYVSLVSKSF